MDTRGVHESVIPEVAEAGGTSRALKLEGREPLREVARKIVEATPVATVAPLKLSLGRESPQRSTTPPVAAAVRGLGREASSEMALRPCISAVPTI
jgi:metal-dependent amidase/aminoacylase/carboxypeptidase family protein